MLPISTHEESLTLKGLLAGQWYELLEMSAEFY